MTLRILSGNGALQIMPFRKLGGKCHFFLRFCTRKRSKTYSIQVLEHVQELVGFESGIEHARVSVLSHLEAMSLSLQY